MAAEPCRVRGVQNVRQPAAAGAATVWPKSLRWAGEPALFSEDARAGWQSRIAGAQWRQVLQKKGPCSFALTLPLSRPESAATRRMCRRLWDLESAMRERRVFQTPLWTVHCIVDMRQPRAAELLCTEQAGKAFLVRRRGVLEHTELVAAANLHIHKLSRS